MVANTDGVEVFKLRLGAADDEIQVKDLYFVNTGSADFGDRVDFKLYDDAGALIQQKQMTGTTLHFQLANQDRIRVPKNDSITVTVKVDVRDINKFNQTGKRLVLALSSADGTGNTGVEAVTAATGSDLTAGNITIDGTPTSDEFVAYRTMLTFANAATQPTFAGTTGEARIFNFTVTNDAAYDAILNEVTVRISASSPTVLNPAVAETYKLLKFSDSSYSGTGEVVATTTVASQDVEFTGFSDEVNGTNYYSVSIAGGYNNDVAVSGDSISTTLLKDAAYTAPASTAAALQAANHIVWSDRSNSGSTGAYLNGYELILPNTAAGLNE